jgi:ornithine decarboxylase
MSHFLPSEIAGTCAALLIASSFYTLTGRVSAAVFAASLAESVGFYSTAIFRECRRQVDLVAAIRNVTLDFGPAEIVDTFLLRPMAMYFLEGITHNLIVGVVLGKLLGDVFFYAVAIPSHELRRKIQNNATPTKRNTPYLAFDLRVLSERFREFVEAFPDAEIHYAMKCNPDEQILRTLHAKGANFEIASAAELDMLMAIGVDPSTVLFSNPVKRSIEIEHAAKAGVWRFAADSLLEIEKLARVAPGSSVFLRMAAPKSDQSEVQSEGKFGIDETQVYDLARLTRRLGLKPYGLAFHVGSQMLDPFAWEPAIASAGRVMRKLQHDGIAFVGLNVGGGFPVGYENELVPDIQEIADVIKKSMDVHLPYDVQCFAEPGRILVAEAGTMVTSVIGVAHREGQRWVHLDVGAFNGMMEALETKNALHFPLSDSLNGDQTPCHLTGPSCDSQDTILFDTTLSYGLTEGDVVKLHYAGAYTTSYASTFNGFEIPKTVYLSS